MDPFALDEAITSYQRQIDMAVEALEVFHESEDWGFVPAHAGYRQLRIIEEKRGNLARARALCEQDKAEGWADNWDHHIARIDRKLAKQR